MTKFYQIMESTYGNVLGIYENRKLAIEDAKTYHVEHKSEVQVNAVEPNKLFYPQMTSLCVWFIEKDSQEHWVL